MQVSSWDLGLICQPLVCTELVDQRFSAFPPSLLLSILLPDVAFCSDLNSVALVLAAVERKACLINSCAVTAN